MSSQTLGSNGQEGGRGLKTQLSLQWQRPAGPRPDPHSLVVSKVWHAEPDKQRICQSDRNTDRLTGALKSASERKHVDLKLTKL